MLPEQIDEGNYDSSAGEQIIKLYDKAYELVYYKKYDNPLLLEKIAKRNDLGEKS